MTPAGAAAKGFITSQFHATGADFPVFKDIKTYVYDKGLGNVEANRIGCCTERPLQKPCARP